MSAPEEPSFKGATVVEKPYTCCKCGEAVALDSVGFDYGTKSDGTLHLICVCVDRAPYPHADAETRHYAQKAS